MIYRVELTEPAAKQLAGLPAADMRRVRIRLEGLAINPRPQGVTKLKGEDNIYRIRVGSFRVLYAIEDGKLLVLVLKIGDRKDVYRGF